MCHELAQLGMAMARATAQRALANQPDPTPDSTPEPDPAANAPDHQALAFARLSRSVRQCIALEAQIAAPPPAHTARHTRNHPTPDPRRIPVKRALANALANHPDRAEMKAETDGYLEQTLAADPDQTITIAAILDAACTEYNLTVDFAQLPTDLLDEIADNADPDPP